MFLTAAFSFFQAWPTPHNSVFNIIAFIKLLNFLNYGSENIEHNCSQSYPIWLSEVHTSQLYHYSLHLAHYSITQLLVVSICCIKAWDGGIVEISMHLICLQQLQFILGFNYNNKLPFPGDLASHVLWPY